MSSSKEKDFFEINKKYIDSLINVIALKDQDIEASERTIALLYKQIEMLQEHVELLQQLNDNLNNICEAAGLV